MFHESQRSQNVQTSCYTSCIIGPLKDDAKLYKVNAEVNSPTHISTNGPGNNGGLKP